MFSGLRKRAEAWREVSGMLMGEGVALGRLSGVLAHFYAERPAIRAASSPCGLPQRKTWNYAELEADVSRLAAAHRAAGVHGKRVLLGMHNRIDVLLHILAVSRAGGVPIPVNARLKPQELRAIKEVTGVRAVVADGDVLGVMTAAEMLEGMTVLYSGAEVLREGLRESLRGMVDLPVWLAKHPQDAMSAEEADAVESEAVALFLCTSGTTGTPKAAALTSKGLLGTLGRLLAAPVGRQAGWRKGRDILLCALPLTHVMGLSSHLAALSAGICLLHQERFEADAFLMTIEREKPNVVIGVPTMYADLEAAGAAERDLTSVQLWVSGADVMPPDRARRFQSWGSLSQLLGYHLGTAFFADIYGMVELSGPMALRFYPSSPSRQLPLPALSFVLPGFEVRAVDEKGQAVGWGVVGQLQARGAGVLKMYEGAAETGLDGEGWFTTGDLARIWPGGLFSFAGRSRDRLKVSGFSVFPAEVEEILRQYEGIRDVVLVGLPDARLGERPTALLIPTSSPESFDVEAFLSWTAEQVAGYRRPRQAFVVDALPRGNHGKIDRRAATKLALEIAAQFEG